MNKKASPAAPIQPGHGFAHVPVVMQMENVECGAACLDMILAYYKCYIPLENIRKECGVSRNGSNLKSVYSVAVNHGLVPRAFRYSLESLQTKATYPCIIHWNFDHFVVLDGFHRNKAVLNDPARGYLEVSMQELSDSYTGICMTFEPGEQFEPGGKPTSVVEFAREQLQDSGSMFLLLIGTTLVTGCMSLMSPGFSRFFVDGILASKNEAWREPFIILMLVTTVLQILAAWLKASYLLKLEGRLALRANTSFIWHILSLPIDFFEQRMPGDILERHKANGQIASTMISQLVPLLMDSATLIFYLVIMLHLSVPLALVGLAATAGNLVLSQIIARRRINYTRVLARSSGRMNSTLLSGIDMIETIKASGTEQRFFSTWLDTYADYTEQSVKNAHIDQTLGQLPGLLTLISGAIVTYVGAILVISGEWTTGIVLAFNGYLTAFNKPAASIIASVQSLLEMRTDVERIHDVMHFDKALDLNETASDTAEAVQIPSGRLSMRNVVFGYDRLLNPLLNGFSLELEEGHTLAIVGGSGSGKSTVARLITRLYEPWSGEILLDGKPVSSYPRSVLAAAVGYLTQENILFEETIMSNLTMSDPTITSNTVSHAAQDACIHEEIASRPGGYQYRITNQGREFSGGQRQRLDIARVLAQQPKLLILDEVTSALDSETEYHVMQNILQHKIPTIIISHRLSIVRGCDQIIVMKQGEVIDCGRHEELMKRCEYYRSLIAGN